MSTSPRSDALVTVGEYTLLTKLGEGGMGVVHLARRPGGDRVALKVLRPQVVGGDDARQRLEREVASLSRVRSRWVAEVLDADPWGDVPFVATRYVPGLSLHDHVVEEGPIRGRDLLWFAGCLAEGVTSVHDVGVLHRDIKPSNVLMEGRTPILIDFGLARVADDPRLTHTGWLIGTPGYLAPEILYGDDASAASDVHSWAATVAYAGTGRAPFGRGPSMAVMDRVRRGEHDLTGLHGDLADVVEAALDPDPERRPTLSEILAWLRPQTTQVHRRPVAGPLPETLPVHVAAWPDDATRVEPLDDDGYDEGHPDEAGHTAVLPTERWPDQPYDQPYDQSYEQVPEQPRVPPLERARRGLLLLAGGVAVGVGVAAAPYLGLALVLVLVWLLRSGSLAAGHVGERRRLRGRRWYDAPLLLVRAPWDVLRSVPSTLVLQLWAIGLALAAGLLCYTFALGTTTTLLVGSGAVLLGLWWGPGGSRVRSPLGRVVRPLSARPGSWVAAVLVVLVLAAGAAYSLDQRGPQWSPAQDQPIGSRDAGQGGGLSGIIGRVQHRVLIIR
ncbi:Serine/threonine-protein kinase AfsK [Nocardioides dokdonensis FR1436]|uniref:Serine/threonine-protein kinase AfsK n=1 Tax=Nocardioides dokdonensis FR1436 TaxID=1300347 RepID=A0A1A9GLB4_9ACTN|nr:serine/threonine-protein kinase [Nocardioides dokdonensis]ANH38886.1 Serine/threonine-protein kinase AfsK [Nocardioides dokdonensis FR1436]